MVTKENNAWKFFRAKKPDELWQIDLKGPYTVHGKRWWFLVCIDDYSRYLLITEQFDHYPRTEEITALLINWIESQNQSFLTMAPSSKSNGRDGANQGE